MELKNFLPVFVVIAIVCTVIFTELIKRLDKKDFLKGYRVWIPALISLLMSVLSFIGGFLPVWKQLFFWWAVIFAVSVFFYEAILKKLLNYLEKL